MGTKAIFLTMGGIDCRPEAKSKTNRGKQSITAFPDPNPDLVREFNVRVTMGEHCGQVGVAAQGACCKHSLPPVWVAAY